MEDIESLRQQLREAQQAREDAETRIAEEQRRREEAELRAQTSLPQTLPQYLEGCHALCMSIDVVTDPSSTTQGDTTDPTGRIFPRRIVPWTTFEDEQMATWAALSRGSLATQPVFPSAHQLQYVQSTTSPISSENGLRDFARDTVENAVRLVMDQLYDDPALRERLGLRGRVTFESHTNLGPDAAMATSREPMASTDALTTPPPRPRRSNPRKTRGRGNRADQFCIYRTTDGQNAPAVAIEYKAPHKLTRDQVVAGLTSEIQPARDVMDQDGDDFQFAARKLMAAVVTQLFSYMVGKGLQHGYICTGETLVFLHIPADPTTVHYAVCVPNLDVMDDDDNRLHRTAVAQVLAFLVRAIQAPAPPLAWHDAAAELDLWAVEFDDVLKAIPATERKSPQTIEYKPRAWAPRNYRSPIRTRARCKPDGQRWDDTDDDQADDDGSPTTRDRSRPPVFGARRSDGNADTQQQSGHITRNQGQSRVAIQDAPYCTHKCLRGLAHGGPMDPGCPNAQQHGHCHLDRLVFLDLITAQLARDRGVDAHCAPLHWSGALGCLFKLRLTSHGYTMVAKGMARPHVARLRHEDGIYGQLRAVQGLVVPVCLGIASPERPQYYDGGIYDDLLLLSYAGRQLKCVNTAETCAIAQHVKSNYQKLHQLGVLHRDAEARNIMHHPHDETVMLVDFERAQVCQRKPLSIIDQNMSPRKRKRGKSAKSIYAEELNSVLRLMERLSGTKGR